jgi:hypothetical protein
MKIFPSHDDDMFWKWGRFALLLHDNGWFLARNQIVILEATWPTHGTFNREERKLPRR